MQLKDIQKAFVNSILDQEQLSHLEPHLNGKNQVSLKNRMSVYRNGIFSNLRGYLSFNYPLCKKLLGNKIYQKVTNDYIRDHLVQSCLILYGEEYPQHLAQQKDLMNKYPFLADLGQYEWSRHSSFFAIDEETLSLKNLLEMGELAFQNHPLPLKVSTKIIQSKYPLQQISKQIRHPSDNDLEYQEGNHNFMVCRQKTVKIIEIDGLYAQALKLFPLTPKELTKFFLEQQAEEKFEAFMQFLFQYQLVSIAKS